MPPKFSARLPIAAVPGHPDFLDLSASKDWRLDLRYATENNFLCKNLYRDVRAHYLHRVAGERLVRAAVLLKQRAPQYQFLILDALRPASVQAELWASVEGTAQEKYIANPKNGSIHSFGLAVDLALIDSSGHELDMGTPFDEFDGLAEPQLEEHYLGLGQLTPAVLIHRHCLRDVMHEAGFTQLPEEWWHFDALPQNMVRKSFALID